LKFKSLIFYGVAIAFVLVLFKVVTAYGESSLKAPTSINGRYRLYTQNPNCLKSNALILAIQQSGIYLNGSLLPASTDVQQLTTAEQKPSLTGVMSNNQISLAGRVPSLVLCNNTVAAQTSDRLPNNSPSSVKIQSQVQGETLEGKMSGSGIPEVIGFTARKEAIAQPSKQSSSH
jgi:hypothetical protein